MHPKNRILISLPVSGMLFLITACGFNSNANEENNNRDSERAPTVEVLKAGFGSLPLEERLTGVVRARNQTGVYPEIAAPITEVYVNNGDRVKRGDPLVKLQDTEFRERLKQAESGYQIAVAQEHQAQTRLNQMEIRLNRIATLADRQLESQAELEAIQAEVESAKANLALAQAQRNQAASVVDEREAALDNTIVRATTDGFIGLRSAEVGQQANTSTPLFEIGDTENVQIQMVLTERMTGYIKVGQTANLYSEAMPDTVIQTQVTRISPFLNPVTHTTQADIEVQNGGGVLRPGMYISVDILYGETDQATLIPNNALYNHPREGVQGVYVADALGTEYEVDEDDRSSILGPTPVSFVPVNVVAKGRMVSGVRGISSDTYVVTMGQNLLVGGHTQSYFRMTEWDRILDLQQLHARDIFRIIEEKYRPQASSGDSAGG